MASGSRSARKGRNSCGGRRLRPGRHDIGHQRLGAGVVLARHHDRFAQGRVRGEGRLDLSQLDAVAADLHLMVDAAEELEAAGRRPAAEVAGAVEAPAGEICVAGEGVGHEDLGCAGRLAQVAATDAHACHADLAGGGERHRQQAAVEQVEAQVAHRPTDRHARGLGRRGRREAVVRDVVRALRRTEGVEQRHRRAREPAPAERRRQRLAGGDQPAQGRHPVGAAGLHLVERQAQQRWHGLEHRHRAAPDSPEQGAGLVCLLVGDDQRRAAHQQRREHLPDRDVEALGRRLGDHVHRRERKVLDLRPQVVEHAAVLDHGPLGFAGRARGEQHVGEVGRAGRAYRSQGLPSAGREQCAERQRPGRRRQVADRRREAGQQPLGDQRQRCAGARQDAGLPFGRVARVERQIRLPRPPPRRAPPARSRGRARRAPRPACRGPRRAPRPADRLPPRCAAPARRR